MSTMDDADAHHFRSVSKTKIAGSSTSRGTAWYERSSAAIDRNTVRLEDGGCGHTTDDGRGHEEVADAMSWRVLEAAEACSSLVMASTRASSSRRVACCSLCSRLSFMSRS